MTIGERIKARRIELGLTQNEAAGRIGWGQAQWSDLEHDRSSPTVRTLGVVANALRCTAAELISEGDR